jgi:hypothetical protein
MELVARIWPVSLLAKLCVPRMRRSAVLVRLKQDCCHVARLNTTAPSGTLQLSRDFEGA